MYIREGSQNNVRGGLMINVIRYNFLLTLETSAIYKTLQAKNIPCQPLLIKPVFSLFVNAEKAVFQNLSSSV